MEKGIKVSIIADARKHGGIKGKLIGPVAHSGFQRLN
ncbi:MAG: hypothetical protein UY70_C0006G0030 [Candidatus Kaiserbacteria bacterium GW2011_GWB1_52_6]|uniref:Uncharacterized protein n=2 Tax=Candidatus Kaiseribacteriota TaxID=1752734 RepID=A0A0G2AGB3_9BACT|nr:MAG: hypothetical protein UY70_C0006G0030 [Candidatus Kaiserbacteria bacterium GW2011_GWB1_52_6]KKW31569.1 MAG: hypothetical protein UY74_C0011G0012 [Candidatus Kaiserbacteria bacterium GW2011_GWC2_52_8b]